ncbi:MAG: hypothetical protein HYY85_11915 [Deltaproteobacteria bacterium]|nr:hypothetical protein [Deltaproteobacteria bacterium]
MAVKVAPNPVGVFPSPLMSAVEGAEGLATAEPELSFLPVVGMGEEVGNVKVVIGQSGVDPFVQGDSATTRAHNDITFIQLELILLGVGPEEVDVDR